MQLGCAVCWMFAALLIQTAALSDEVTESSAAQQDSGCPRGCLCKNQDLVDCRSSGINKIPDVLYQKKNNITKLDLSHNDITNLGPLALEQFTFLEDLNLASNPLTEIHPTALHHPLLKSLISPNSMGQSNPYQNR